MAHLDFQHIPIESYKHIWKSIKNYYRISGKIPSMGVVAQDHVDNDNVLDTIDEIKKVNMPDIDEIINGLENYFRRLMFIDLHKDITGYYERREYNKTFEVLKEGTERINNFTIKDNESYYKTIFSGFDNRQRKRIIDNIKGLEIKQKVPFSIDELDVVSNGGIDKGDTAIFLSQSGVGKTTLLRWIGANAARRGFRVAHFQLEGTEKECIDGYDSTWSAQTLARIEGGEIDEKLLKKLTKNSKNISDIGDISIYSKEKFDSINLREIRNKIIEIKNIHGEVDLVLIDYFELTDPGDGRKYKVSEERQRRDTISKELKNIAVELNVAIITATQASDVNPKDLNNPDFIITRHHTSEFKGVLKPFSYFITLNQTKDEYKNSIMRLYCGKIRKYKSKQIITIKQSYSTGRFYDRLGTQRMKEDENEQ